ncbi:MAG: hypothetical protein V7754_14850 [Halioglobus sp.]
MKNLLVLVLIWVWFSQAAFATDRKHMNTEHASQCKREVMTQTHEFQHLPMAAFSVNGTHHHNILWNIHWNGQTANGSCKFHDGRFGKVEIHTHLKHASKQKHGNKYKGAYGGFYYDRHVGQWRDPDGHVCHTCTPENGFPRYGG